MEANAHLSVKSVVGDLHHRNPDRAIHVAGLLYKPKEEKAFILVW